MDKCAALTTLLENRPDRLVFTRLANGEIGLSGTATTFTDKEVQMMLGRRFGFDADAAQTAVLMIMKTGEFDFPVPEKVLSSMSMQKTANTAVVVDMYEVDYQPKTLGYSTQEIDKKLDIIKDFVTRYTFPDTTIPDIVIGPREQVLKHDKQQVRRPDLPDTAGVGVPLEHMTAGTTRGWRRTAEDLLPGGQGDDALDSEFDAQQLSMGVRIEQEHTGDPRIAREIARDHLREIPDYYTKLKSMEMQALQ